YSVSSSLTGGWGASEALYSYPEMQASNKDYTPNVFCYAVKEHVEFESAGQLAFTYVCNSTVESEITKNMDLYHPVMVTQSLLRIEGKEGRERGWAAEKKVYRCLLTVNRKRKYSLLLETKR